MSNVTNIGSHPRWIEAQIRELGRQLQKVSYSMNINDLVSAREVSMRAIWDCIEEGEVVREHIHHEANGVYAKLRCHTGGDLVELDVLLPSGEDRLEVLYATAHEGL